MVMGIVDDQSMTDQVQVILVITGLGAPTLEETLSKFKEPKLEYEEPKIEVQSEVLPPATAPNKLPVFSANSPNLDSPAFLRRRSGYVG